MFGYFTAVGCLWVSFVVCLTDCCVFLYVVLLVCYFVEVFVLCALLVSGCDVVCLFIVGWGVFGLVYGCVLSVSSVVSVLDCLCFIVIGWG